MLTIVVLILIGITLAHVLADTMKAAIVVLVVAAVFYLARGVSFEALVDEGARSLYDSTHKRADYCARPERRI